MLEPVERLHWPDLLSPLSEAMLALGRLHHALQNTPLHPAWLWREIARMAAKIGQNAGYRVTYDQLVRDLAGLSLERTEDYGGIAAGRRIFLNAGRLFRAPGSADSIPAATELFEPILGLAPRIDEEQPSASGGSSAADRGGGLVTERQEDLVLLRDLVRAVVSGSRRQPVPLVGMLMGMRSNRARQLSPTIVRLALPLALHQAGLVPKVAPALLGGRLSLSTLDSLATASPGLPMLDPLPADDPFAATEPRTAASPMATANPATLWLARALTALAKEADGAVRRLDDLTKQHRAWHAALTQGKGHQDSRARLVVDLLAATPVLSTSLVARHLGCTPQGAAKILADLVEKEIISLATAPRRWKIYLASDLALADRDRLGATDPLDLSEPLPDVDCDAIEATLDGLFADLERLDQRTRVTLASNGTA